MVFYISNAAAIAAADAVVDLHEGGTPPALIKIYAGSVPADADAAIGGATLLATLTASNPMFGNAADATPGATATASAITKDSSAAATGAHAFFRTETGVGATVIMQGLTGTSGADINFGNANIDIGAEVSITSLTYTQSES